MVSGWGGYWLVAGVWMLVAAEEIGAAAPYA